MTTRYHTVMLWGVVSEPELTITRDPTGNVVLTWQDPVGGPSYLLQQCTDLTQHDWSIVIHDVPGQYEVMDPVGTRFFRLTEP